MATIAFYAEFNPGTSFADHGPDIGGAYSLYNVGTADLTYLVINAGSVEQAAVLDPTWHQWATVESTLAATLSTLVDIEIALTKGTPYSQTVVKIYDSSAGDHISSTSYAILQIVGTDLVGNVQIQGTVHHGGNTMQVTINDYYYVGTHIVRFEAGPTWGVISIDGVVSAVAPLVDVVAPGGTLDTLHMDVVGGNEGEDTGSCDYIRIDDVSAAGVFPPFWRERVKTIEVDS